VIGGLPSPNGYGLRLPRFVQNGILAASVTSVAVATLVAVAPPASSSGAPLNIYL
jgi:hypothetical protein